MTEEVFTRLIPPRWQNVFNADLKPYMDPREAALAACEAGYCYYAFAGAVMLIVTDGGGRRAARGKALGVAASQLR